MTTRTLDEFNAEGVRRFGEDRRNWRFACPMCGNVATPGEFKARGADPERAATECIGRTFAPMPKPEKRKRPCDWAAYGLFRTCGRGQLVRFPDGHESEAFAFADAPAEEGQG
jgi:hypothetical protein